MTTISYPFSSTYIKKQLDYVQVQTHLNTMLKITPSSGSQKIGVEYATFYKESIDNMLQNEKVDVNILKLLQKKVHEDLIFIRNDRKFRSGNHPMTDAQTRMNDIMMSLIMDFIATLPEPE